MEKINAFRGKTVVITGASAGVGRATARAFAKAGARIALLARGIDGLEGARRDVTELGGKALAIPVDVAEAGEVEKAATIVEEMLGDIDIWINNAMCSVFSPFKEMNAEEYKRVTEVTYLGQVYGTMAALKRMLPKDEGAIILVGSALAYRGIPLQSAYCGAKHGVEGFFDSLRCELIHDKSNIKLTMVQLPALNTIQFSWVKSRLPNKPEPMGKIYQPEVAARAILYAATRNRREIYVGFPTVKAIIGDKIAPDYADWRLAKRGYDAQQTNEPADPDRKDNVWNPLPGDHGAHGSFGKEAHARSFTLWLSMHKAAVIAVLAALITLAILLLI